MEEITITLPSWMELGKALVNLAYPFVAAYLTYLWIARKGK